MTDTGAARKTNIDHSVGANLSLPGISVATSECSLYRGRGLANAMTVDVEDYFQVSAFEKSVSRDDWVSMPSRLHRNISRILEIFDEHNIKGTFFSLAWVAKHHPQVIHDIVSAGHELASHGCDHRRVTSLSLLEFKADIRESKRRIEDVSGMQVRGYRAPSFSVNRDNLWIYEVLGEEGYEYSSSVFPVSHDHYGIPDAPRLPFRIGGSPILEVPMTCVRIAGKNWPCAGGGYFRLLPTFWFRWAISRVNTEEGMPAVFYLHPWELDPGQPRITGIPIKSRLRHYINLHKFERRLRRILSEFRWDRMDSIYLDQG